MESTEQQRPPGYRFYPTEEELVGFYLPNQLRGNGGDNVRLVIPVVDVYDTEPWNLPSLAGELCRNDKEQWFFFAPRQEKEARGGRPNRSMAAGYWKATGSPSYVYSSELRVIGLKKTMVFYQGKAPSGTKTKWKMNEYKAIIRSNPNSIPSSTAAAPQLRNEFTLCRVYVGSGCARAFDRRPMELGPSGESMLHDLAVLPGVHGEEQGCDHQTLESPDASPNPGLEAAGWLELDWDEL